MTSRSGRAFPCTLTTALLVVFAFVAALSAQSRLKSMPGYEQHQKMAKELPGAVKPGALSVTWKDATTFEYARDGKLYRYDVANRTATEAGEAAGRDGTPRPFGGGPDRGRQVETTPSPDGKMKAFYRDRNLWLAAADGTGEVAITTDGSKDKRIKYGTASWVYGEELDQVTAMWWSPDGSKIGYYRFDESRVPDYHLQVDQTKLYSSIDTEAYPKSGQPNPVVDMFVYDVPGRKTVKVDVRGGKPFDDAVVGHYVYDVRWSPDGRELLFNRSNRLQTVMELVAANPATGACRVVIREEWPTGWVENSPAMFFLEDGKRFIWQSERSGWKNFYLYDISGRLINEVTRHAFEVGALVKVDEARNLVFYLARDGDNYMKMQLHRVGLDGKKDVRLTDPAYNHSAGNCMPPRRVSISAAMAGGLATGSCGISPDNRYFVDVYQAHDAPPATRLVNAETGAVVAELAASDTSRFAALGLKKAELFTYRAADGKTLLHGLISFPSNFDPARKYPALVSVYGGPAASGNCARETFVQPTALAEYGFLVLNLDTRATPGMGKRQLDALYRKLGITEIDDLAEGVKALWSRPYFDKERVGIFGTSYGGYATLLALLRHPEVFKAGSASSSPTAWYHYDSIYTERYMGLPQDNPQAYEGSSAVALADRLTNPLLLYYGTADNNVHPTNSMQLIQALQKAGKSFEVQVGPDAGHSSVRPDRMMEFLIENLVVRNPS
jgi:dipeptidyl-peptidase-4